MVISRPLQVGIAAETIPYLEGGLGHFILNAVNKLADAEPLWQFKVVSSSSFTQLASLQKPNVEVILWDNGILQRATARVLRNLMPSSKAWEMSAKLGRFAPFQPIRKRWGNLKAIWKSLGNVDVIWVPHFSIVWDHLLLSRNFGAVRAPILFTIHDIHPVFFPDDWPQQSINRFWQEFVPFATLSRSIVTHTRFQKAAIVEHLRIEPARVLVTPIPPLIDLGLLAEHHDRLSVESLLSRYHIGMPFALYPASTTHAHKNHSRLLLAWAKLQRNLGDRCPTLVCTAKGHLWSAYRALIEALELQDKVIFTDLVDTKTLGMLYQSCLFVIVPTLYEGGGSGPVGEACLVGKPVLCSQIPQIEEQLESYGCYAMFFAPDSVDSITQAVEAALAGLLVLESRAQKNQSHLIAQVPILWRQWADFYAEQMSNLATSYGQLHSQ